jgi:AraC-like DNA-binding protein
VRHARDASGTPWERESRLSAPLIFLAIDVATIVCAILLGARVLASQPRLGSAWLIALIAFAMASGALLGHQEYGYWTPPAFRIDMGGCAGFLDLARNLTPGLFMVLCFTLFSERRRFPRWLLVLLALQLGLDEPGRALIPPAWPYARLVTQAAPAFLQMLFAGFALYWIIAEWRFDLVETRRAIRALTLVVGGGLVVATGLLTQVLIDPSSHAGYIAHEALAVANLTILAFVLFRFTGGEVGRHLDFEPAPAPASATTRPRSTGSTDRDPALARLTALLEEERICEQAGLTLNALADRVGLPEYRLRKLIHEELGYRNFNALLHDYRIREACRRLGDPALRRTPILTIALSVGYASINTFSRGFREVTGVTPSAWREAKLAAGGTPEVAPKGE